MKFKAGDRVRSLESDDGIAIGNEYLVTDSIFIGSSEVIGFVDDDGDDRFRLSDRYELVEEKGAIDWSKPLEHVDGTPLRLAVSGVEISRTTLNPDFAGDYYLVREDGKKFTCEQRTQQAIDDVLIIRPNGASWRNEFGPTLVRNRAEAVTSEWGAEIEVNGVRPDWLRDDEKHIPIGFDGHEFKQETGCTSGWDVIKATRLPANHPYYLATSKGFTYWPGGDAAPGDWAHIEDEKTVLLANGEERYSVGWWDRKEGNACSVIGYIGYRRKPKDDFGKVHTDGSRSGGQPLPAEGTVTIARMTPEQWGEQWPGYDFRTLAGLGLVREETRAERFTRMTGYRVTPDVAAALEWERG